MGIVFLSIPYRSGKQGNFLGQVALGWGDLDPHPCEFGRDLDLPLKIRDGGQARDQQLVQGTIQLRVEPLPVFEVYGWEERGKGRGSPRRGERTDQRLMYIIMMEGTNCLLFLPFAYSFRTM